MFLAWLASAVPSGTLGELRRRQMVAMSERIQVLSTVVHLQSLQAWYWVLSSGVGLRNKFSLVDQDGAHLTLEHRSLQHFESPPKVYRGFCGS